MIHNAKTRPFLRGEGMINGKFFDLQTWRSEGLFARLREAGFNVRTLADRIARLPAVADVGPAGASGVRILANAKERLGIFDHVQLRWRDLPLHEDRPTVELHENIALRRRKGRGKADFYITALARDHTINLLPVTETEALMHTYSQIAASNQPALIQFEQRDQAYHVPRNQLILPPPHAAALDLLGSDKALPWTFTDATSIDLAEIVFDKLGVELRPV